MKRLILFLTGLFTGSLHAQLIDPSILLLSDSNNVRLHLQEPDRLIMRFETEVWNPASGRYECPLPDLLRSQLLVNPPFTHLRALQKEKDRMYEYPEILPETRDTFERILNRESFDSTQLSDIIELKYDRSGRLVERFAQHFSKASIPDIVDRDTIRIRYDSLADGKLLISIDEQHHTSAAKGFYASIYFTEDFSKSPLHLLEHRQFAYFIGKHNELLEYTFQYEVIANGKKGNWLNDNIRKYTHDNIGRIIRIQDSLIQVQLPLLLQEKRYEPLAKEDWSFWQQSIQMQRFLKKHPGNTIVRSIRSEQWYAEDKNNHYVLRNSPLTQTDTSYQLYAKNGELIARLPESRDQKYIYLRQDISDSMGQHYGWYRVYWPVGAKEDSAQYQPGSRGEAVTLKMGCVVETYLERPRGTLPLSGSHNVSKNSIRLKNRGRFIEYGQSNGPCGEHAYWAPVNYRYDTDLNPNFILTSPDGRLLYMQDDTNLFKIEYLP